MTISGDLLVKYNDAVTAFEQATADEKRAEVEAMHACSITLDAGKKMREVAKEIQACLPVTPSAERTRPGRT